MRALAIIPARGGSKRIPRKNIKNFNGKPIIWWVVKAVISSGVFDRVVVSTEDEEIANIAESCGAEVPFRRDKTLADDFTGTVDVVSDAVAQLKAAGDVYDVVCCIYATAVFTSPLDLKSGLDVLLAGNSSYVFPAAPYPAPIDRRFKIVEDGKIELSKPNNAMSRTQDLEPYYYDLGQFYWARSQTWEQRLGILDSNPQACPLQSEFALDIDNESDWRKAEMFHKFLLGKA